MKLINKFLLLAVLLSGFTFMGCDDDLTDLNIDPNEPVAVPAATLLTQAQFQLYERLHSRAYNAEWTMLLVQHWAQTEYAEDSRYVADATTFDATWTDIYANALNELVFAKDIVNADEGLNASIKANQLAVLEILLVDGFHTLTDGFGSIPYTQALSTDFDNPSYDDQSMIYMDLLSRLDAAVASISPGAEGFSSGDVIGGGDMAAWKKLGASLLMRIAMRVADVDSGTANTYVNKAMSHGVISSNAENALFVFDGANPDLANPLYVDNVLNNRDDFAITEFMVETLKSMDDPRLGQFAMPNNSGDIKGMPYGLPDADAFALSPVTSRPSQRVRSADAPHVIIDYAEVAFLMAEAIERGYTSGDAAEWYNMGVMASMEYWGIMEGVEDYLEKNAYDSYDNWREAIGVQKWIAFYMNGPQAWAEWRRLDYPRLEVPAAASNPIIPLRLPYPISEDTNNGSNIDSVTDNINDMNERMWWDVN